MRSAVPSTTVIGGLGGSDVDVTMGAVMQVMAVWTALSILLTAVFAAWMRGNDRRAPALARSALEAEIEALALRVPA